MPITTPYVPLSYAGDGVANSFAVTWPYQHDTDLVVQTYVVLTQVTTTLVLGTDYYVTPALNSPAATGTVTTTNPVPAGTNLLISRDTPVTQLTTWVPNDPNLSTSTMNAVDKLTMIEQEFEAQGVPDSALGSGTATAGTFLRGGPPREWSNILTGTTPSYALQASGSSNPWDVQMVLSGGTLNWQFYGGSLLGGLTSSGNLTLPGTITAGVFSGTADASLITTGTIATARLGSGSGSANSFLNGLGQFTIPSGGGGINTTTTGTFTIAAVNSSQTVPVTSATGIVVGTYLLISDGTHAIIGNVTVIASLNLTVTTQQIVLGTAGNTMASGASVQAGSAPGNNSILIVDNTVTSTPITTLTLPGDVTGYNTAASHVPLGIVSSFGGNANVSGYIPYAGLKAETIAPDNSSAGLVGLPVAAAPHALVIHPTAVGQVISCTAYNSGQGVATTISWGTIGASSITAASLTPALLNCTNALTDTYVFGYDSASGHFKMFPNTGLPAGGNAGQFVRGDGVNSNILDLSASSGEAANRLMLSYGTANGSFGMAYNLNAGGTTASWFVQKRTAGSWGIPTGVTTNYVIGGGLDGSLLSINGTATTIDSSALTENIVTGGMIRTASGVRSVYGPLSKIYEVDMTGLSTITLDLNNGAYQRLTGFTTNVTITLTDTTPLPSNGAFRYAGNLRLEINAPGSNTFAWLADGGSIVWNNGAAAPTTFAASGISFVDFERRQGQTVWIGSYSAATGTGTVTSVASGSGLTGGPITTTGTLSIANLGVTAAMIANNTITNAQISASAGIAPSKLALPGGTTNFLRADGNWAVPPGTGGGGGGPTLAGNQTWTGVNTYTNNSVFNGPQTFNPITSGVMQVGNLSSPTVGDMVNLTLNNTVNSTGSLMGIVPLTVWQTIQPSVAITWNPTSLFIHHEVRHSQTSGFSIGLVSEAFHTNLNGGTHDSVFFMVESPNSDVVGNTFSGGQTRIGEVNYANLFAEFNLQENNGGGHVVGGLFFFPAWNSVQPSTKYNVQFGTLMGPSLQTAADGNHSQHWIGHLVDQNAIAPGGYGISVWGAVGTYNGTTSGPYALLKLSGTATTGIDFTAVNSGSTALTATSTGAAVITMADDQSIKLGSIWLRGHSGALQYSTNGTAWSNVTLP